MRNFLLILFPVFLLLSSCSSNRPEGNTEAEVLFREAQHYIEKERYLLATEKLNTIKSQHPYSFYATDAELLLADILFFQENFLEAQTSYALFLEMHPRHSRKEYILWQLALSYEKQLPSSYDRDLSPAIPAIKHYKEFMGKYPKSPKAKEARQKIAQIEEKLQKRDMYIANFYKKTEDYHSALYRYELFLSNWSKSQSRDDAYTGVLESLYALKRKKQCLERGLQFGHQVDSSVKKKLEKYYRKCLSLPDSNDAV